MIPSSEPFVTDYTEYVVYVQEFRCLLGVCSDASSAILAVKCPSNTGNMNAPGGTMCREGRGPRQQHVSAPERCGLTWTSCLGSTSGTQQTSLRLICGFRSILCERFGVVNVDVPATSIDVYREVNLAATADTLFGR